MASLSANNLDIKTSRSVPPGVGAVRMDDLGAGVDRGADVVWEIVSFSSPSNGAVSLPCLSACKLLIISFLLSAVILGSVGATRPCVPGDQSSSTCIISWASNASARLISCSTRSNVWSDAIFWRAKVYGLSSVRL